MAERQRIVYDRFCGVDFSTDATRVDARRSPLGENMIADAAGFPEKRPGHRILYRLPARVNALCYALFADGTACLLAHAGTELYRWEEPDAQSCKRPERILTGLADRRSRAFAHGGALYLIDGEHYLKLTHDAAGFHASDVRQSATVPCVRRFITGNAVTKQEDGTFFGGHTYEEGDSPNMLTPVRTVTMCGDGVSTVFFVGEEGLKSIDAVTVNGTALSVGTAVTCDLARGRLCFQTAPAPHPDGPGFENITVRCTKAEIPDEYAAERILHCTACGTFGAFNDNRFFFTASTDRAYANADYMSAPGDPAYFPESGMTRIGAESGEILGYLRQYDGQLILKRENGQDAAVFLRTAELESDGTVLFAVRQGVKSAGATGPEAMGVYRGEPLFLTGEGLFGVLSGNVRYERALAGRSFFVDAKLTKEPAKEEAVCAAWMGLFFVFVNGNAYVMDGRRGAGAADAEWYWWTDIPVRVAFPFGDELYLGTAEGHIEKLNADTERMERYADGAYPTILPEEMTEEERAVFESLPEADRPAYRTSLVPGRAIRAVWATRAETFGDITRCKTVPKRGAAVMIKPYTRSSVRIRVRTDRDGLTDVKTKTADIFDFSDIDFGRVCFYAMDAPKTVPLGRKFKKCTVLQLIFENAERNEGFGVYGAEIAFDTGGWVK
ncbi:MAG: hypothetical protein Q4C53_08105 [Clostridia bacterium]|nr:hypothetical protein [Clostridia bacterium]